VWCVYFSNGYLGTKMVVPAVRVTATPKTRKRTSENLGPRRRRSCRPARTLRCVTAAHFGSTKMVCIAHTIAILLLGSKWLSCQDYNGCTADREYNDCTTDTKMSIYQCFCVLPRKIIVLLLRLIVVLLATSLINGSLTKLFTHFAWIASGTSANRNFETLF
jgi:hypothetical protein